MTLTKHPDILTDRNTTGKAIVASVIINYAAQNVIFQHIRHITNGRYAWLLSELKATHFHSANIRLFI